MRSPSMQLNLYGRDAVRHKGKNTKNAFFTFRELAILKSDHFEKSAILNFFFKKNFFLLHSHENQSKFIWQTGWVEILTFSLVSSKFLAMRNKTLYSVDLDLIFLRLQIRLDKDFLRSLWIRLHFLEFLSECNQPEVMLVSPNC